MPIHREHLWIAVLALSAAGPCRAEHDLEFVAEHLPEVAMDNRYATLPVWNAPLQESSPWGLGAQGAASLTEVGTLQIEGPLLSAALSKRLGDAWELGGFVFYDSLSLQGGREHRPLQTLFAPQTPIERPVGALFTNLDGRAQDFGGGAYVVHSGDARVLGAHRLLAGILWQRVDLDDYRFDYQLVEGPQQGLTGSIDFDATYDHWTPFVGIEIPRDYGQWTFALHGLLAYPLPRRGFAGHITGPGFEFSGDSASAGNGTHFGDPSVTLGFTVTYRPAMLSIDIGTLLTQALLEPMIHSGIDRNLLLSVSWAH